MTLAEPLSGEDYRLVLENSPWPCLILRPDFTVAMASEAYLKANGMRREDLLDRPLPDVFPSDPSGASTESLRASLERVLRTRQPDSIALEHRGATPRNWSLVNSPVLDDSGAVAYLIHRIEDLTDLVQLKRAGREHSRMTRRLALRLQALEHETEHRAQRQQEANRNAREDMMRQLAGAVAHDFNDLLTVIAGTLSVVEDVAGAPAELRQFTAAMQRAIERGSQLTSQLLSVGRGLAAFPDAAALKDLLRDFSPTAEAEEVAAAPPHHAAVEPAARARGGDDAPDNVATADAATAAGTVSRCGRILVVEDDPDVLNAVLGAVARLGYGTVAARDGQEALAALDGPEPPDLLFTDVIMPKGMNGVQLARRARELRPNLPVLLTSGYGFHALSEGEDDGFPVLQKPYQRGALAETLRQLLGS
jgi:PAS domain S-box-containing protein